MKNRSSQIRALVLPIIFLGLCSCKGDQGDRQQSRAIDACYYRVKDSHRCGTSFQRLIVNPNSADGRIINIVGYLAVRNGIPLLYPNEDDYLHDVVVNSIHIRGNDLSVLNGGWYKLVRLEGEFRMGGNEKDFWFGVVNAPVSMNKVVDIEQESPDDLHVDVELLDKPGGGN